MIGHLHADRDQIDIGMLRELSRVGERQRDAVVPGRSFSGFLARGADGGDFRDGQLASDTARNDLAALTGTLITLSRRLDPAALGPLPLAAKFT